MKPHTHAPLSGLACDLPNLSAELSQGSWLISVPRCWLHVRNSILVFNWLRFMLLNLFKIRLFTYFFWDWTQKNSNLFSQDRMVETGSSSVVMTHRSISFLIFGSMSVGMDSGNPHHRSTVTVIMTCSHVPPVSSHTHAHTLSVSRLSVAQNQRLINGWAELGTKRSKRTSHIYDTGKILQTP